MDIAVLITAAMEGAGVPVALMQGPVTVMDIPSSLFIRVQTDKGDVTLDPRLIDRAFADAVVVVPGFAYREVQTERVAKNYSIVPVESFFVE